MAKLYRSTGEVLEVQPEDGKHFSLKELQKHVGGYIENVFSRRTEEILVVNEEGKVHHLPLNEKATEVFTGWFGQIDVIVGDALLCTNREIS